MEVLIVRHGIAEPVEEVASGKDEDRQLTEEGQGKMIEIGKGLKILGVKPEALWTSPLIRARQTADCLVQALEVEIVPKVEEGLAPGGSHESIFKALSQSKEKCVALVGHEPCLSELASMMVAGKSSANVLLKKGAVCCISFSAQPRPGLGILEGLMQPKVMRLLAKGEKP